MSFTLLARSGLSLAAVSTLVITGCQLTPTKVAESDLRRFHEIASKGQKPIVLTEKTIVLDARSAFHFGLSRVTGSHHLTWESLAESADTGEIMRDRRRLAQRLSLFGLDEKNPIVVVGTGPSGGAEEGRLAWTLVYLGFRDVQAVSFEALRKFHTQMASPPSQNIPPRELEGDMSLVLAKSEFQRLAADPKGRIERRVHILDVRSPKEYMASPNSKKRPDIGAINIEWREFYNSDGRPNVQIKKRLASVGVSENDRIILVSDRGVRSSAAAYALISLGYSRIENFLEGYRSLQ